jgi:hypothetical protein
MVLMVWWLAKHYFALTPADLGLQVDGTAVTPVTRDRRAKPTRQPVPIGPGGPWRDRRLQTLAAASALALFAQIGLIMQLFSLLVPALGQHGAGLVMAFATVCALAGRSVPAVIMRPGSNRRLVAVVNSAVQICGSAALLIAAGSNVPLLVSGSLLYGTGIGNVASLPALIVQSEFAPHDVPRAVALVTGISQGCFAFAPLAFGALRTLAAGQVDGQAPAIFATAGLLQIAAVAALLLGMPKRGSNLSPNHEPNAA